MKIVNRRPPPPKVGYGLVRDRHGVPKFDKDPNQAHPAVLMQLTQTEKQNLGVWTGSLVKDAHGTKRVEYLSNGVYKARDTIVALSELWKDNDTPPVYTERVDIQLGEVFTIKEEES